MKDWTSKREDILSTPLPVHTGRYSVIPHFVLINELQEKLAIKGYEIESEKYLTANSNQIVTGVFRLKADSEIDIKPSVTFINSYNKTRKAEIRSGVEILVCRNGLIGLSGVKYSRKHLGTNALTEFRHHIDMGIDNIEKDFNALKTNVQEMKDIELTNKAKALLIGDMLINECLINATQLSIVQKELKYSEHFKTDSLYDFYNNVTESFKDNHPLNYDKQHIKFHSYISSKFDLTGNTRIYGAKFDLTTI